MVAELLSTFTTNQGIQVEVGFGNGFKGCGNGGFRFVQVANIVDKGEGFAGVDESEGGGVADGVDGCLTDGVEAAIGNGEGFVDGGGVVPVVRVVVAPGPFDAGFLAPLLVEGSDPDAFVSTNLLQGEVVAEGFGEAEEVHPADDGEALDGVCPEGCLVDQALGVVGSATSVGVEAHQVFADPLHLADVVGEGFDGGVGDAGAGTQEEGGNGGAGDEEFVVLFEDGDRPVVLFDAAMLEIEKTDAIAVFGLGAEVSHRDFGISDPVRMKG